MALSTLLCRVPVQPLPALTLLERFGGRKIRKSQSTALPNGLKVVTARGVAPHSYVGLYSKAGSRFEAPDAPIGTAYVTNQVLKDNFEARNDDWLATGGVSREHSWVSLESAPDKTAKAVRALGEVFGAPKIDANSLETAKAKLCNEAAALNACKADVFDNLALSSCYESTGLGRRIFPDHHGFVSQISKDRVKAQAELHDVANSVLVAVGDVDHNEVVKAAEAAFGQQQGDPAERLVTSEQARFISGTAYAYTKDHDVMHGAVYEVAPGTHSDAAAFHIMPHCFGYEVSRDRGQYGGDSWDARKSVHLDFIRETKWRYAAFEDAGAVYFRAVTPIEHGTPSYHQEQSINWTMNYVLRWMFALSDLEFKYAQARCLHHIAGGSATSASTFANEVGTSVLRYGYHFGSEELANRIALMSKDEFCSIINKYIHNGLVSSVAVGGEAFQHYIPHDLMQYQTWRWRD